MDEDWEEFLVICPYVIFALFYGGEVAIINIINLTDSSKLTNFK